jgi:hypothetical protein
MERDRRDTDKDNIEIIRTPQRTGVQRSESQRDTDVEVVRPGAQQQIPPRGPQSGGGRTGGDEASGGGRGSGSAGASPTGGGFALPQWSRRTWTSLAAAGLAVVMGYMLFFGPSAPKTDEPTPQYQQERTQRPSLPTVSISTADVDQAMTQAAVAAANAGQSIPGLPNVPPSIVRDIRKGEVQIYSIQVFDDHDEDGDIVKISLGNGMEYGPLQLTNGGTTIAIPVKGGVPPSITLHAIQDGYPSYGVTCGIKTSDGFWYSNILPAGATQQVPLMAR